MASSPDRRGVLSSDTTRGIERRQIQIWRRMSPLEKARLVSQITAAADRLALAGIRQRHPRASDRECFLRLVALKLGPTLTRTVYADAREIPDLGT